MATKNILKKQKVKTKKKTVTWRSKEEKIRDDGKVYGLDAMVHGHARTHTLPHRHNSCYLQYSEIQNNIGKQVLKVYIGYSG